MSSYTLAIILSFVERTTFSVLRQYDGVCVHPELSAAPNSGHVDFGFRLWLRLTKGQSWFKAIIRYCYHI